MNIHYIRFNIHLSSFISHFLRWTMWVILQFATLPQSIDPLLASQMASLGPPGFRTERVELIAILPAASKRPARGWIMRNNDFTSDYGDKPSSIWVNKKVTWNVILEVFGFERWSCKLRILETGSYDLKRIGHTMIIANPPYFHIMKHSDIIN